MRPQVQKQPQGLDTDLGTGHKSARHDVSLPSHYAHQLALFHSMLCDSHSRPFAYFIRITVTLTGCYTFTGCSSSARTGNESHVYELLGAGNRNWFRMLPERRTDKKTFGTTIRASETCMSDMRVVEVRNAKTRVRQRECVGTCSLCPSHQSQRKDLTSSTSSIFCHCNHARPGSVRVREVKKNFESCPVKIVIWEPRCCKLQGFLFVAKNELRGH